ncbi:MAG: hypothetical protein KKH41_08575 [Candidatus Thermoplasmatota archaeon]|nr:hypothetical protein [Euryarchaeota archaeon]MBU4032494.1 hypothetical protein [Candidatus Thermoplasmatota archaeon]MBU4070984.1 hypothetical protein [Candidatus Thermoplasmatota archaeon]MBU4144292.1 hypothetical protein [Candidatus Thermoplasmatota archaeon]MBU4592618.1 hypothetical protein [Candidatus Thermoplasmatota archaeon]
MSSIFHSRRCLSLVFSVFLVFLVVQAGTSRAQQGGIGVDNDGPSFIDISLTETDDFTYVNVEVKDLNGWNDIFSINVTIMDNQDRPISRVSYMQYSSLGSTSVATILWNQTAGDYLDTTRSTWIPLPVAPWNPDNAVVEIGLRVSFAFHKFSGYSINILAMDRGQLTCEYNGPFSAEYTPAPVFSDVVIPISLSSFIGIGGAGFMVYRRHSNNKLAKAVEASHSTSGEK